jgi:hypothetical protein
MAKQANSPGGGPIIGPNVPFAGGPKWSSSPTVRAGRTHRRMPKVMSLEEVEMRERAGRVRRRTSPRDE